MQQTFKDVPTIHEVVVQNALRYQDSRGWLSEFFRSDELDPALLPAMGYVSQTLPHVHRGPHEHVGQTDIFFFLGAGEFLVTLWDNRSESVTFEGRLVVRAKEGTPTIVIVPPRVVHAYACVSDTPGMVVNVPNRLYRGPQKKEPVDEVRHEDDPKSPYVLDLLSLLEKNR